MKPHFHLSSLTYVYMPPNRTTKSVPLLKPHLMVVTVGIRDMEKKVFNFTWKNGKKRRKEDAKKVIKLIIIHPLDDACIYIQFHVILSVSLSSAFTYKHSDTNNMTDCKKNNFFWRENFHCIYHNFSLFIIMMMIIINTVIKRRCVFCNYNFFFFVSLSYYAYL